MSIADQLALIRERISAAARRAGRNPDDIVLMAVCKTFPAEAIREAYTAGQRLFGENRVQEFAEKFPQLAELKDVEFHMIGHLQSNKAAKAAEIFHAVDSIDSAKLARRLNDAAQKLDKVLDVLIEINAGGEEAKSGLAPDSPEIGAILSQASAWQNLKIRGLMTVPPFTDDPEGARAYFRGLRELRDRLATHNFSAVGFDTLSMGMSHDFEVAIEEGSTCVRIGTAIFGERLKP
ncbi:MAG TPA: YggS family pyridoxal phosphate-dependent enzyme [Candidatus Eisenbacteria bacterium]|nr:YggS family pyridoxal phosphate-dependent enzyme [Candidatus Eisenbacteria bacterium]